VKVPVAHLLQGSPIQASIEARYFFGEPVASAKVIYVVHTSQHYWWDEDEADENGDADASADANDGDDTDSGMARPSSRSTRACWMRMASSR